MIINVICNFSPLLLFIISECLHLKLVCYIIVLDLHITYLILEDAVPIDLDLDAVPTCEVKPSF